MRLANLLAVLAALLLSGCDLRYALLGFPEPRVILAKSAPLELLYREAKGGLMVLTAAIAMPVDGKVRKSCFVNAVREEREGPPVTVDLAGLKLPVAAPVYSDRPNPVNENRSSTRGAELFRGQRVFIDYPGRRLVTSPIRSS